MDARKYSLVINHLEKSLEILVEMLACGIRLV
jgi:hypothetical protein